MKDEDWGPPLTGAQMRMLWAAGLPNGTEYQFQGMWTGQWQDGGRVIQSEFSGKNYRLPANHPAYTLLEADWLDGRNVALWFGGKGPPPDWLEGSAFLCRNGTAADGRGWRWSENRPQWDIIAYTAIPAAIDAAGGPSQ